MNIKENHQNFQVEDFSCSLPRNQISTSTMKESCFPEEIKDTATEKKNDFSFIKIINQLARANPSLNWIITIFSNFAAFNSSSSFLHSNIIRNSQLKGDAT